MRNPPPHSLDLETAHSTRSDDAPAMPSPQSMRSEYEQICLNFRLLTDLRFKLLALLPIGAGVGVTVVSNSDVFHGSPLIGLFGFVITLAVAGYNARNDQLYDELVGRAAHLERILGMKEGSFANQPGHWLRLYSTPVSHRWPMALIYGTSLSAWLYLLFYPFVADLFFIWSDREILPFLSPWEVDFVAVAIPAFFVFLALLGVRIQREKREIQIEIAAFDAVNALTGLVLSDPTSRRTPNWREFLSNVNVLAGIREASRWGNLRSRVYARLGIRHPDRQANYLKRLEFYLTDPENELYWDPPEPNAECDDVSACQLVGLLSNFPPRRIRDIYTGRTT